MDLEDAKTPYLIWLLALVHVFVVYDRLRSLTSRKAA